MANRPAPRTHAPSLEHFRQELQRARERCDELREMHATGATRIGECDDCHADRERLYDDPDEPGAGWAYCGGCLSRRRQSNARRIQVIQQHATAAGYVECRACGELHHQIGPCPAGRT